MKLSVFLTVFVIALSIFPSTYSRAPLPPTSSSFSSSHPSPSPVPSTTSTPVFPPHPTPAPTPDSPTTLIAPSSSWSIRITPSSYVLDFNTTTPSTTPLPQPQRFPITAISAKLAAHIGLKQYDKQTERLTRYTSHLERRLSFNHSHDWKSDHTKQHKKHGKHYNELSSFYLRHAQCRACTQPNYDLLLSSSRVSLPSYQPYEILKFCPSTTPLLPHEIAPSAASPHPLQDWEGVCIPATSSCPVSTIDLNILSPTTCANDLPITKQSCALCVLDGYEWRSHRRAVKGGDNYDGTCTDPSTPRSTSPWSVSISQLDQCPSALVSAKNATRFMQVSGAFSLFFFFTASLCACLALRKCCRMRKARLARAAGVTVSVAPPVPTVSSSPSQVSGSSSQYPGQVSGQRVVVSMNEPLLSGLNPPYMANPPPYAYPRV